MVNKVDIFVDVQRTHALDKWCLRRILDIWYYIVRTASTGHINEQPLLSRHDVFHCLLVWMGRQMKTKYCLTLEDLTCANISTWLMNITNNLTSFELRTWDCMRPMMQLRNDLSVGCWCHSLIVTHTETLSNLSLFHLSFLWRLSNT